MIRNNEEEQHYMFLALFISLAQAYYLSYSMTANRPLLNFIFFSRAGCFRGGGTVQSWCSSSAACTSNRDVYSEFINIIRFHLKTCHSSDTETQIY